MFMRSREPTSLLSSIAKIMLLVISIISVKSQVTVQAQVYDTNGTLPAANSSVEYNFTITPGTTDKVELTLVGTAQILVFNFQSDTSRTDAYKLTVTDNGRSGTTTMTYFQSPETLFLSLDTTRLLFVLQGNLRFRISKYLRERQYQFKIHIEEKVIVPIAEAPKDITIEETAYLGDQGVNKTLVYYIVAGIIAGCMGIVVGVKLFFRVKRAWKKTWFTWFTTWSRLRKTRLPRGNTIHGLITEGPALMFARSAMDQTPSEVKHFSTMNEKALHEIDYETGPKIYAKKDTVTVTPGTLSSLEHSNSRVTTNGTYMTKVTHSNGSYGSLQNVSAAGVSLGSTLSTNSKSSVSSGSINETTSATSQNNLGNEGSKGVMNFLKIPSDYVAQKRTSVLSVGDDSRTKRKISGQLEAIVEENSPHRRRPKLSVDFRKLPPIESKEQGKRNTWFAKKFQITPLQIDNKVPSNVRHYKNELDSPAPMLLSPSPLLSPELGPGKIIHASPIGTNRSQTSNRRQQEQEELKKLLEARGRAKQRNMYKITDPEQVTKFVEDYMKNNKSNHRVDIDSDCESSEDERENDFQLPNYFCCMICFKGDRTVVSEPCGHIFACKECTKKVMSSSKVCILCAGKIKGNHILKMAKSP